MFYLLKITECKGSICLLGLAGLRNLAACHIIATKTGHVIGTELKKESMWLPETVHTLFKKMTKA